MPLYNDVYLQHYGVLGMKWGVRRYRNEDGSLTEAGLAKQRMRDAKDARNKSTFGTKKRWKASVNYEYTKREYSDAKVREKLKDHKVSKHEQNLIDKYKKQGLTDDEANIRAYNTVKKQKILAACAGVAVTAAVAYAAYKHYDKVTDRYIDPSETLKRVTQSKDESASFDSVAYVFNAKSKRDTNNYTGFYADQRTGGELGRKFAKALGQEGTGVYTKTMNASSKLKVASRESGRKVLQKAVSDGTVSKKDLIDLAEAYKTLPSPKQSGVAARALRSLNSGKVDDNVYDLMNLAMTQRDNNARKGFTEALKKAGYDAIKDRNDTAFSGYGSKTATIILDTSKLTTKNVSEISEATIRNGSKAVQNRFKREANTSLMAITGVPTVATIAAQNALKSKSVQKENDEYVKNYRNEHPNSTKTYNEILKIKDSSYN